MWSKIFPYWFLILTIGFGWFILAPLIPALEKIFNVPLSSVLFIISSYGYTMAILGLLAGFISARFTVRMSLILSSVLSFIGLLGRALSILNDNFGFFLLFAIIAALAYPLAVAPIGSIAESLFKEKSQTIIGISVGLLFLGMSLGSFLGPSIYSFLGIFGTLMLTSILGLLAMLWTILGTKGYPIHYNRSLRGSFNVGMIKNWYVGLAIASVSVMFGSVASTVLLLHKLIPILAISFGGFLGGLAFLGSALGAILLPPLFENNKRLGLIFTGLLSFISSAIMSLSLAFTVNFPLIALGYFLFGFFGNAYWSMSMNSTINYVSDPAKAGLATSMYSVVTNIGVAIIPVFLGSLFGSTYTLVLGVIVVMIMELVAGLLSFTLKVNRINE